MLHKAEMAYLSLFFFAFFAFSIRRGVSGTSLSTYIIQIDRDLKPDRFADHHEWHNFKLQSLWEGDEIDAKERIVYSYGTVFHGLSARLSESEAERMGKMEGVVSVFPETTYHLHTTRSPGFLGLDSGGLAVDSPLKAEENEVIVGILDTGIWPESESFRDEGMPPVPKRWKGECETGKQFPRTSCNKKIVGARVFFKGYEATNGDINEAEELKSARDQDGHGTHTAATVAGVPVPNANLLGYAPGTAKGMAPGARVAAYKVCWSGGCSSSDILAAVDRAVSDGVDVLSISLGGGVSSYYRDTLSVAAFGAMEKGVFVACSAGNAGPDPVSLTNVAPWVATVGASTLDRDFPADVYLGDKRVLHGASLYSGRRLLFTSRAYPLFYMGSNGSSFNPSSLCMDGTLNRRKIAGKILICDRGITPRVQKGVNAKLAGAVGMILTNTAAQGEELIADSHLLPAVAVGQRDGDFIKRYLRANPNATARLGFKGTRMGVRPSPVVAAFSSRGPNIVNPEILKPDFLAPGVNILAAWTGDKGPSSLTEDKRRVRFNILSGTSMSCPHVGGVAAYIKARHRDWSPAAVKSALMTTAYVHDNTNSAIVDSAIQTPSNEYDFGAGHINPVKALDPGLVYDIDAQAYFDFLCSQFLSPLQLLTFSRHANRTCRRTVTRPGDLNYPAISVVFPANSSRTAVTVHRTVTNVGGHAASYHAVVTGVKSVAVRVVPDTLNFTRTYEKLTFKVILTSLKVMSEPEFGGLVWKDGVHKVRSPIVLSWSDIF